MAHWLQKSHRLLNFPPLLFFILSGWSLPMLEEMTINWSPHNQL